MLKRKIADYSGPKGENVLYNIDQNRVNAQHLHSDSDAVYDLGGEDEMSENAERVQKLAEQIKVLANQGQAEEIQNALAAKVKYNN